MLINDLAALLNLIEVKYLICRLSEPIQRSYIIPRMIFYLIDGDPPFRSLNDFYFTAWIDSWIAMLPEGQVLFSSSSQTMHPDKRTLWIGS